MTPRNASTTKPTLLWSERGQIGCTLPGHAPYRGTDTWIWERWKKLTRRETAEFERDVGRAPSCECCDAIARRAQEEHEPS
jgi:hypothetical protein